MSDALKNARRVVVKVGSSLVTDEGRGVDAEEREARVKDFVKRFKFKGPVFQISALTHEGCQELIKAAWQHIKAQQVAEQPAEYIDPRFAGDAAE